MDNNKPVNPLRKYLYNRNFNYEETFLSSVGSYCAFQLLGFGVHPDRLNEAYAEIFSEGSGYLDTVQDLKVSQISELELERVTLSLLIGLQNWSLQNGVSGWWVSVDQDLWKSRILELVEFL